MTDEKLGKVKHCAHNPPEIISFYHGDDITHVHINHVSSIKQSTDYYEIRLKSGVSFKVEPDERYLKLITNDRLNWLAKNEK